MNCKKIKRFLLTHTRKYDIVILERRIIWNLRNQNVANVEVNKYCIDGQIKNIGVEFVDTNGIKRGRDGTQKETL